MRPSAFAIALLISLTAARFGSGQSGEPEAPPNFVLILADDQGWVGTSVQMDPNVEGSRSDFYRTPNLERLARQGMTFAQAYAPHPNCSPTRLAIQLGLSPARRGMTDIIGRNSGPFYEGNRLIPPRGVDELPAADTTIAEWIKSADPRYATAHFGKWHLAGGGPGMHGYDEHDGPGGHPAKAVDGEDPKLIFTITKRATDFIERQAGAGRPFFVQVSHHAVHLPIEARDATRRRYLAADRGEKHDHPGHAGMTEDLDTGVGLLLDKLDELGISGNTYLIYTSDNGSYLDAGKQRVTSNDPLAGLKATVFEGGIRVPLIVRGPGIAAGSRSDAVAVGYDIFPTVRDLIGSERPLPEDVEGGSLAPILRREGQGTVERPREELVWHFPHYQLQKGSTPQSAIRLGDFKLIRFYETGERRLYNLAEDLGEARDLASEMPEKVEELSRRLDDYLAAIDAPMPRPNPDRRTRD